MGSTTLIRFRESLGLHYLLDFGNLISVLRDPSFFQGWRAYRFDFLVNYDGERHYNLFLEDQPLGAQIWSVYWHPSLPLNRPPYGTLSCQPCSLAERK